MKVEDSILGKFLLLPIELCSNFNFRSLKFRRDVMSKAHIMEIVERSNPAMVITKEVCFNFDILFKLKPHLIP